MMVQQITAKWHGQRKVTSADRCSVCAGGFSDYDEIYRCLREDSLEADIQHVVCMDEWARAAQEDFDVRVEEEFGQYRNFLLKTYPPLERQ